MKTYCEVKEINNDNGTITIDFEIYGNGSDRYIHDFDLSSIGKIRGDNMGGTLCNGWIVIDEADIVKMPKKGDRFYIGN